MAVTVASFRANFPEFDNVYRYPDSQITFWLGIADKLVNAQRWGDLYDYGIQLLTAHEVVLSSQSAAQAAVAGQATNPQLSPIPGVAVGMTASKTVDKVSVTYDTSAVRIENAGHFNLTTYGIQFYQLAERVGAGGYVEINQGAAYYEYYGYPGYYG